MSINVAESLLVEEVDEVMIPNFFGENLFGWATCMGSPQSLLIAAPSGTGSAGLWVDTLSWQRLGIVEAEFTHPHMCTLQGGSKQNHWGKLYETQEDLLFMAREGQVRQNGKGCLKMSVENPRGTVP